MEYLEQKRMLLSRLCARPYLIYLMHSLTCFFILLQC
uniref:JMJ909 n=1 Tax=Arundo donax TaxID=35708 RepID=A0A0A9D8S6_ARUDO